MTEKAKRAVRLVRLGFPERPALDTALSHAVLRAVSDGTEPETLRLHRPSPTLSFGPQDALAPGYPDAVRKARAAGFVPVARLAGGRAAVFHEGTIAFAWTLPDPSPPDRIRARFRELAAIMAEAFRSLGVDARVGAVPGEYCPGDFSVNARGRTKLMGVGQRLDRRAAHVGGVVVVNGAGRIGRVLDPVYRALGLSWDPAATGSLQDEVDAVTWEGAERAILDRFAERHDLAEGEPSEELLAAALELEPRHRVGPPASSDPGSPAALRPRFSPAGRPPIGPATARRDARRA